jgi:hypothetical protein
MSQENVESARRGFEAFAQRGPEAVVELAKIDPTRASWSRASWSRASWSTSFDK